MKSLVSAVVAGVVLFTSLTLASAEEQGPPAPEIDLAVVQHIPKDALAFWAADIGPVSEIFDTLVELLRKFIPEEENMSFEEGMAEFDEKLGFNLRDDLFAHLGPEIAAVVDIPPIDQVAGMIMSGAEDGLSQALDSIGLWIQVDDEKRVMRSLIHMFTALEAKSEDLQGVTRVWWPVPEETADQTGEPPPPSLFLATGDGLLTIGFTAPQVKAMLSALPVEERATAGADFRHVAAHLDPNPKGIVYANLPRLQGMIRESMMIQGMIATEEEAKPMLDVLLDPKLTPHGMGSTSVNIGEGIRRVTFGPKWVTGGVATSSTLAAIAIPNLLNAINRGRQKRTMADMRVLGTALSSYAVDNGSYPTTEGWVACSELAPHLSPEYLEEIPATDGWRQPILCLSDGQHFVIVSGGRDLEIEDDYSGDIEGRETEDFDADIVYSDGFFVIYPTTASRPTADP